MILVDSSVWIDYFNGLATSQTDRLDELLGSDLLLTGDIILAEVLQGFRDDRDFRRAKRALDGLEFRAMLGRDIALKSAANYRALRTQGVTVRKTIDMLIATFCIENGHELLHADRDFDPIERHLGLRTV
ncbi:MAG: PIN domain nuclease [Proteobacteria bacterium]|nr:PIN domain nuclease [Pseudomonadota bacterium]